jgi:hypothetical protein
LCIALLALIAGFSRPAQAQSRPTLARFEISAAYFFVRANTGDTDGSFNLNGGSASAAYDFTDRFSLVADFGGYKFGKLPSGLDSTMYSYLFGPRASIRKWERFTPFVQILLGVGRLNANSGPVNAGENGFAMILGGGLDVRIRSHFAIRSIQAEYLMTRFPLVNGESATQNDMRLSTGIVYRFNGN